MTSCLELFALSAFEPPSEWLDAVAVATALRLAPPSAALSNGGSRRTADRQRMGPQDICSLLSVFAAHPGGFLLLPTQGEGPAADVEPAAPAAAAAAASPPPPPLLELLLREAARQAASFSPGQVLQLLTAVSELRGSGASGSGKSASSSSPSPSDRELLQQTRRSLQAPGLKGLHKVVDGSRGGGSQGGDCE